MTPGALQRRLGTGDAAVVGAGSMVGAGVFTVWAPAAAAAGTGLLVGLAVAATVAFCNATSAAQLAALHPESGGTYVYARRQLGPLWGQIAGWGFVVGKTASCVALALAAGAYLWPEHQRLVGVAAVVTVTGVNLGGLSRTVAVTRWLLLLTFVALAAVVVAGWSGPAASLGRLAPIDTGIGGILRSAGFIFFSFAGYARIATLGEEVRDPERTIPRAIPLALGAVVIIYAVVAVTALAVVPVSELASTEAPLRLVVEAGSFDGLVPVVRVGAGIAALGVLLNLLPGISRTVLAMARRHEVPHWYAAIDGRRSLPVRAELTVAALVAVLVGAVDLDSALAFSGVAVLAYYAITNAAALTLAAHQRRWWPGLAVVGLAGCVVLIVALPVTIVMAGAGTMAVAVLAGRTLTRDARRRPDRPPSAG